MTQKYVKRKNRTKAIYGGHQGLAAAVEKVNQTQKVVAHDHFGVGDTVKVHVKIKEGNKERIQVFEGAVIGFSNPGIARSVTVRKISHGVGVERVFVLSSPKVAKIERVQKGKVRRAKLYYLRKLEGKAARVKRDLSSQAKK